MFLYLDCLLWYSFLGIVIELVLNYKTSYSFVFRPSNNCSLIFFWCTIYSKIMYIPSKEKSPIRKMLNYLASSGGWAGEGKGCRGETHKLKNKLRSAAAKSGWWAVGGVVWAGGRVLFICTHHNALFHKYICNLCTFLAATREIIKREHRIQAQLTHTHTHKRVGSWKMFYMVTYSYVFICASASER